MPFNVQCKKCLHYRNEWCAEKLDSPDPEMVRDCLYYRAATNSDRIRAMTDEELDKFLGEVQWDVANYCGGVTQKQEYPVPEQRGAWLEWLKEEAT